MQRGNLARWAGVSLITFSTLYLGGCIGGSSQSKTTISGSAVAGAVSSGEIKVTDSSGTVLATASVKDGDFTVAVSDGALAGELDFEVTGTYTDEVSDVTVTLDADHPLALRLAAGALTAGAEAIIGITPETTVIRQLVKNQSKSLSDAKAAYKDALGNEPHGLARPFAPNAEVPEWAAEDNDAKDAAFRVGAYSQWAKGLGLKDDDLAALPTALAQDLADGDLDGHDGTNPVTIGSVDLSVLHGQSPLTARYLAAMATFAGSASVNVAGLTAPTTGLPPNAEATDVITGETAAERVVTLADGSSVKVSVKLANSAPFSTMQPNTARTDYLVTLTNAENAPIDVTAAASKATGITSDSMMHMLSGRHHSTPLTASYDAATSDPTNGQYRFSVYYVMASAMKNSAGMSMPMGLWDFEVTLADATGSSPLEQTALFHPNVAMPMGVTLSSKGNDAGDQVPNPNSPGMTMGRPYWVWLDSVQKNGNAHDVALFVTTKVGMTFPAVYDGANHSHMTDSLSLTGVTVRISTDKGTTWSTADENGTGHYSVTGLTGLTSDSAADLLVQVTVNSGGTDRSIKLPDDTDPLLHFTAP